MTIRQFYPPTKTKSVLPLYMVRITSPGLGTAVAKSGFILRSNKVIYFTVAQWEQLPINTK